MFQANQPSVMRALTTDYIEIDTEATALCESLDTLPPPADDDPRHATLTALRRESATLARHILNITARSLASVMLKADVGIRELESSAGTESTVALSALRDLLALDSQALCSYVAPVTVLQKAKLLS